MKTLARTLAGLSTVAVLGAVALPAAPAVDADGHCVLLSAFPIAEAQFAQPRAPVAADAARTSPS